VHFGTIGGFDHMPICDNAIRIDEESAAPCQFLTTRIESLDCYCGRFDAAHQFREEFLGSAGDDAGCQEN
jgi:hypothetical protein